MSAARATRNRTTAAQRFRTAAVHVALFACAFLTLAPLVWMVSASLMPAGAANTTPPPILPPRVTFEHYVALFTRLDLARNFANSAIVTLIATLASVGFNSMAGYAFAKLRFRGRDKIFGGLLSALVVPAQVAMLPLFLLLREMGLVNTLAGVLVPYLAGVFAIFLIRQYMIGLPDDLLNAARIDGAGEFRIFWSVVLPVVRPILVTLAAFTFLSAWNDFLWPLIVLSDSRNYTLPVALANLSGEHVQDTELMMAGSVLTILPALGVFLVFQKAYIRGILSGSVKG
ncbi:MAG: carbohydrate ABC transporter permease [Candidatus Eisenbacteria bacterium]|nr:carbohydrate ABC transporter permease [Candidatus Eisenbacteria bacterium]